MTLEKETAMLAKRNNMLYTYTRSNPGDQFMVDIYGQTNTKLMEKTAALNALRINPDAQVEKDDDAQGGSFQCPETNCNGIVYRGKCGVCETAVCVKCREPKKDDHECDKETLENVEALLKTTKACPKCKTRIYKIDGCDQMFCTKCHTAFSWRTGKVETRHIHNPHYFEWMRNNTNGDIARQPGDNPCLSRGIAKLSLVNARKYSRLYHESNAIVANMGEQLTEENINRKRTNYRKEYLTNKKEGAKKQWKNKLVRQMTTLTMTRDLMMVIDMFNPALQTVLDDDHDLDAKLDNLIMYMNEQFAQVCKRHGSKAHISVDNRFRLPAAFRAV